MQSFLSCIRYLNEFVTAQLLPFSSMKNEEEKGRQRVGLVWFTNNLRVHDNVCLAKASEQVDLLICAFFDEPEWKRPGRYGQKSLGDHRRRFLDETLFDLHSSLAKLGQTLNVFKASAASTLVNLIKDHDVTDVYVSQQTGLYEAKRYEQVQKGLPSTCQWHLLDTHTLFSVDDLPCDYLGLPDSFSKFRKMVEAEGEYTSIEASFASLPPAPKIFDGVYDLEKMKTLRPKECSFYGGESKAREHIENYFSSSSPSLYKQNRNELDGWDNSSKFSPWLANGSLSVRTLVQRLHDYERERGRNDSTYWIYFELLWREYFQWYAHKIGRSLFAFRGIAKRKPLTSFYPERFKKWCDGNTPYALVNACMLELKQTGYLSNRGRQIAASCLVNELQVDWRYGAAYFECQLVDYDVASNWGNWQYIAGVGADPRGGRHFNLEKQTELYDSHGDYQAKWGAPGNVLQVLDSVDAADWPIS